MKNKYALLISICLVFFLTLTTSQLTYATSYTAVASGQFSSSTTWLEGAVPSTTISLDVITIMPGVTVDLDENLKLNGAAASLDVQGSLTATSSKLSIEAGTLKGIGDISLKSIEFGPTANVLYTGSLTADQLKVSTSLSTAADITVKDSLKLLSGLSILPLGSLDMKSNTTIVMSGGSINAAGGSIGFSGSYDVVYINYPTAAGAELTGPTLENVTVKLPAGNAVTLSTDVEVDGTLDLYSGVLNLGGKDITLNGDLTSSTGLIVSATPSDMVINTTHGTTGEIDFGTSGSSIKDLIINAGTGETVNMKGSLTVNGNLQLNDSSKLSFANGSLVIMGDMTGNGSLSGSTTSNLTINNTTGISSSLSFTDGYQTLKSLTVNTSPTAAIDLNSDLQITEKLELMNDSKLAVNDNQLTIGATANIYGTGKLSVTPESTVKIESSTEVPLKVEGTIGDLTLQTAAGSVKMGSDITVSGSLTLDGGTMDMGGYDLTVNGLLSVSGDSKLASTSTTDITLNTTASPSGTLTFVSGYDKVGNMTINVAGGGSLGEGEVTLGSALEISGDLTLSKGLLYTGDYGLTMDPTASIIGADENKYIITDANGYVEMTLDATAGMEKVFPVGTPDYYSPAVITLSETSATGKMQVNVSQDVFDQGISGYDLSDSKSVVDMTWHVSSEINADLDMDLKLMWSGDAEVNAFDKTQAFISHYTNAQWDTYAAATATAEANGMYSITRPGITSLSPFAVMDVNTAVGLDQPLADEFSIYPNPATDRITISYDQFEAAPADYRLFDAAGQLISKSQIQKANTEISLQDLMSGQYFIKFNVEGKEATRQIVKM